MGTISSQIQKDDAESGNLSHVIQTELKIDFSKEVNPNLKQLLYCFFSFKYSFMKLMNLFLGSLAEIRGVYEKFRQRSNIPFIDKSTFYHIVSFTRMNSKFIFQNLCHEKSYKYFLDTSSNFFHKYKHFLTFLSFWPC